ARRRVRHRGAGNIGRVGRFFPALHGAAVAQRPQAPAPATDARLPASSFPSRSDHDGPAQPHHARPPRSHQPSRAMAAGSRCLRLSVRALAEEGGEPITRSAEVKGGCATACGGGGDMLRGIAHLPVAHAGFGGAAPPSPASATSSEKSGVSMPKVVLFLPPYPGPALGPPLSLLCLASPLQQAGYEVKIIDAAV